jgi:hypothetical protein
MYINGGGAAVLGKTGLVFNRLRNVIALISESSRNVSSPKTTIWGRYDIPRSLASAGDMHESVSATILIMDYFSWYESLLDNKIIQDDYILSRA